MTDYATVEWAISPQPVAYEAAHAFMEARARAIREEGAPELIWLLEHPPLYTAGTSAKAVDLRTPERFPVFEAGRGGEYTYHGPGQRVAYVMLDVAARGRDVRAFVANLERWIITALKSFNIDADIRDGRVGVWVDRTQPGGALREDKIAAIGIRLKRWVSFHGISLNVEPDLEHFSGITPCGIDDPRYGVTSLVDLGLPVAMYAAGEPKRIANRLMDVTYEALMAGIAAVKPGNRFGDIGAAISEIARKNRFSVVEDFCGHVRQNAQAARGGS